jgi:hypothetical protein
MGWCVPADRFLCDAYLADGSHLCKKGLEFCTHHYLPDGTHGAVCAPLDASCTGSALSCGCIESKSPCESGTLPSGCDCSVPGECSVDCKSG